MVISKSRIGTNTKWACMLTEFIGRRDMAPVSNIRTLPQVLLWDTPSGNVTGKWTSVVRESNLGGDTCPSVLPTISTREISKKGTDRLWESKCYWWIISLGYLTEFRYLWNTANLQFKKKTKKLKFPTLTVKNLRHALSKCRGNCEAILNTIYGKLKNYPKG
jgi:hypothetical protein